MEYLYAQSGETFEPASEDILVGEIDEGFGDTEEELSDHDPCTNSEDATMYLPLDSNSEDEVSA